MNEADRSELAQLQARQRALELELQSAAAQLEQLRVRIDRFAGHKESAAASSVAEIKAPAVALAILPTAEKTVPTEVVPAANQTLPEFLSVQKTPPAQPPSIPPVIPPIIAPVSAPRPASPALWILHCPGCHQDVLVSDPCAGMKITCSYCGKAIILTQSAAASDVVVEKPAVKAPEVIAVPTTRDTVPPLTPPVPPSVKDSSFEMRLGKFGLVRVGIVMLLTGLVFLANLAYQKWVPLLGPAGKVTLLYVASGLLLGAGAWLQRNQKKESLKNYAQVLFAGGLAAVFFTTYAAHHIANLKVIESAVVDGLLLLGWTGFIVWLADRQKSEVLALFAIGLAYYTSIITPIGMFTLYSNLVLTVAAVFFLVRNRWATVSFASLVATYVGFGFWRFIHDGVWLWDQRTDELFFGNLFLTGYWILFSAAAFLSRSEKMSDGPRALFASLNNGAYFALVILSMLHVNHGSFWKFSLGFGAVLLSLSLLARRVLPGESALKNAYLTQGLLLVTVGLIAYFTGLKLALVLAAESVVLFLLASQRNNPLLRAGGLLTAALAVAWGFSGMKKEPVELWLGTAVGALVMVNACIARRYDAKPNEGSLRPEPGYFSALGLLMWLVTTWENCPREWLGPVLALEALLFTGSFYVLKVREITLLGQGYLVLAQIFWLVEALSKNPARPWWNPVIIIAATLAISHWWQRQTALHMNREARNHFQAVFALAVVGILFFWLHPTFVDHLAVWLAFSSLLAIGITIYGLVTRAWFLAIFGQFFLLVSAWEFVHQLLTGKQPEWYFALAPLAALLALAFVGASWFERHGLAKAETGEAILHVGQLYRWVAVAMSIWWVLEYIPAREQCWVLMLIGALVFIAAGWRRKAEGLLHSAVFFATGLGVFLCLPTRSIESVYFPNLLAILALPALQQLARRRPENFPLLRELHVGMIIPAGLWIWLFLSRWVLLNPPGRFLILSWSLLAVLFFSAGRGLRERSYHGLGYLVLSVALARVDFYEVWQPALYWPHLLPVLLLLIVQQIAKRLPKESSLPPEALTAMIIAGGLSVWLFVSRGVMLAAGGSFYLTASWAALALVIFAAGFGLRERLYRWLGLVILACALGRVVLVDVWDLKLLYQVLSFMALGLVLVVLGFIYNKYEEKIKEWL